MYTCGPTVYHYSHIGNLRAMVFPDIVRRVLEYKGYEVKAVMNITDFGHLAGDGEDTEDKMSLALKREGKDLTLENMRELGEVYTQAFIEDLKDLNVEMPFVLPRASDHIQEQIAFVSTLLQKGYAYTTSDGIYFDTQKFSAYGVLGGSASSDHSRVGVNAEKKDPRDFALWKNNPTIGWESPWGKGFPGWHIECTAMATKYLGKSFDIHTGGMDLAPIHHNNEIAEAESVTGKQYVRYWMHNGFITVDGQKISKSLGNTFYLQQLKDKGVSPLAFRYWLLTGHYRQQVNFTWEAVQGAQTALQRAHRIFIELPTGGKIIPEYQARFEKAINDDLNTAEALAVMWELLKDSSQKKEDVRATLVDFDRVFGIGFGAVGGGEVQRLVVSPVADIPEEIQALLTKREEARKSSEWALADGLRDELLQKGYVIEDTTQGPVVRRAE